MKGRDYLIINSMSRTGTSLLYQLLYGHPDILLPPFRIQFCCRNPLGFPAIDCALKDQDYRECLAAKTTTPVNIGAATQWSNIEIKSLSQQGFTVSQQELEIFRSKKYSDGALGRAVEILHSVLGLNAAANHKYYCLHDDHAYVLSSDLFAPYSAKALTTIRSPLDMLASKKNMLLFHLYKTTTPTDWKMSEKALERELARAVFSWLVASYEYSKEASYYPILFEHMKGEFRSQIMIRLMEHLDLEFHPCLESDQNELPKDTPSNELLYAGSSLQHITKGKSNKTVGSSSYSPNEEERGFLLKRIEVEKFHNFCTLDPKYFYANFHTFWSDKICENLPVLSKWMDWYRSGNTEELFREYSSYNYGFSNAAEAFER